MRMLLLLLLASALVQSAPPDTEIYLAPFSILSGKVTLGPPVNVSNSPGYDNQPSFTPDGKSVLFTSVRGGRKPDPGNGAASGSDIYRFDIAASRVHQVTDTPESEYSPTVMPDGTHFSTVRVEADGTQRLWRFNMDGTQPVLVLADVKPVGYHAWVGASTLALFVLGTPPTLQLADVTSARTEVVFKGINRSIQRMPDGRVSFVFRDSAAGAPPTLTVRALDVQSRAARTLVAVPAGASEADTAWTPDGTYFWLTTESCTRGATGSQR